MDTLDPNYQPPMIHIATKGQWQNYKRWGWVDFTDKQIDEGEKTGQPIGKLHGADCYVNPRFYTEKKKES